MAVATTCIVTSVNTISVGCVEATLITRPTVTHVDVLKMIRIQRELDILLKDISTTTTGIRDMRTLERRKKRQKNLSNRKW